MRDRPQGWAIRTFAACSLLVGVGCTDGDDPAPEPRPAGDLRGAEAVSDGETIWVLGGTVVSDAVWNEATTPSFELPRASADAIEAGRNHVAIQYDSEGHVLQTVDLGDIELVRFFTGPNDAWSAAATPSGVVLAGQACLPFDDGCQYQNLVLAIVDGRARRIDVDVPDDESVRILGGVADEVYLAVGRPGGSSYFGESATAYAVDPADPRPRRIALPPHVGYARSLCLLGDQLAVVTIDPVSGDGQTLLSIGLVPTSGSRSFDPVEVVLPVDIPGEIAIACPSRGPVVLEIVNLESFPLPVAYQIDLTQRSASAPFVLFGDVIEEMAVIGDDLLVASSGPSYRARPRRWVSGVEGEPGPLLDMHYSSVVVGGRLLDVSGLLAHVPGGDGPAPLEVSVPPVDEPVG